MTLKLEVGKTYVSTQGFRWTVLCQDGGLFVCKYAEKIWRDKGSRYSPFTKEGDSLSGAVRLVKEYKEPVTHTRDVVWYRDTSVRFSDPKEVRAIIVPVGRNIPSYYIELNRQTVTYTEE